MGKHYNTALAGGVRVEGVGMSERVERHGSLVILNDIVTSGIPKEFSQCEVIFSDVPWPHGLKIFDERAGVSGRHYDDFSQALSGIVKSLAIPVYLTLGKTLLKNLPAPSGTEKTILNKAEVILAWWNVEHTGPTDSVESLQAYLGQTYAVAGDFCCGYGESMFNFLSGGGKRFIASDYDGHCVSVVGERLEGNL